MEIMDKNMQSKKLLNICDRELGKHMTTPKPQNVNGKFLKKATFQPQKGGAGEPRRSRAMI